MKRLAYFFSMLAIPFLMGSSHPFFVSITEVEYSSKTKELGIATKFFPDDLEEALRKSTGKKFDIIENPETRLELISLCQRKFPEGMNYL
jgi:hypothetical protein